ncbi:NAD-dependent epimerase/dehydratase family protein [Mycobacterium paragordonae]|uniref:NAD-dependent epimerase/dehydratase family protein n=1 Tax=Mycobacterium paragordonae TaxID=1389713 RepID=A0A4R5WX56_9MYCO|nr:NAD-dependent epimerase/dehydratase family protein [Mycobacterium paragordonae]MDP7736006.1 NAD-dependent epimerase/dehydratase family protein [Mycobacterium paragordonae]TDK99764.1 NAD-dependent epimerase/dehydratase family protein [Mycobacterium paragordonae]TDL05585.1 NAD-dependent epimerase/dehydratase family protein [Mycobacterium paragordonae]
MTRRIAVTGASGNVGTALLRAVTEADYEVVGIARRQPSPQDVYRHVEWHQLDVADNDAEAKLRNIFRDVDCVVHLAWGFQPTRNARYLYEVGIRGTSAVLGAADGAGVPHMVHMSSLGAYAPGRYGEKVDESWSTAGLCTSTYSRAKSAAENLLDDYEATHTDGVGITRLRPGLILQRNAAAGLRRYTLPAYIDPGWLRWLPVLPLDRSFKVSMVHADDVADACVRAIERRALGPFNLAAEPPVTRDDIADALGAKAIHVPAGLLGPLVQATWRARLQPIDRGWLDMAFSAPLLATDRARQELGWTPRWSSLDAFADLIDGLLHDKGMPSPVLWPRSLRTALMRDVSHGPVTTRPVP